MQIIDQISSDRLTKQIELFRQFLVSSFPILDDLMEHHDWDDDLHYIDDWVQINWELLVERELLGKGKYLTPLSVPLLTRVTNENALPNYSVNTQTIKSISDLRTGRDIPKKKSLRFFGFCTALEKGFGLYPPFDLANLVLDSTKELFIVPFVELEFYLLNFKY